MQSPDDIDCIIVEICNPRKQDNIRIINLDNPCPNLTTDIFKEIAGNKHRREVWCGDFNGHYSLWGGNHTDRNGNIVEVGVV